MSVEETGPVERKLKIEIPTTDVDRAFDQVFKQFGKSAHIKGFRKGKAPRSVIEKYYSDQARGEVLERLVRETLFKAIEEQDLDVLGEPRLDPGERPQQGSVFVYVAAVEIRPEIELKSTKGLKVVRPVLPEPEKDPIDAHLEQLREQHAQILDTEDGTTSARGHLAVLDYEGFLDGEPFEGGKAEEAQIDIGAGRTIPGFEDNLVGLVVGDEREFQVTFPDDYPAEHLTGKEATFKVKLHGLKRRELPELDDEFAKDVSEHETLAEFRAEMQTRVDEGRAQDEKRQLREAVVDALVAANPFPVPPTLIEMQLSNRIQRAMQQFGGQLPEEQAREMIGTWTEEWRPQVERDLSLALLVPEIAKEQELEVSPEEIDARLAEIAAQQGKPLAEVRKASREDGMIHAVAGGLLEEKVVELLVSEATLSDA
ncbi:MAG: trigger factor [bacterium]|nr:trigger factor [bacterium]